MKSLINFQLIESIVQFVDCDLFFIWRCLLVVFFYWSTEPYFEFPEGFLGFIKKYARLCVYKRVMKWREKEKSSVDLSEGVEVGRK